MADPLRVGQVVTLEPMGASGTVFGTPAGELLVTLDAPAAGLVVGADVTVRRKGAGGLVEGRARVLRISGARNLTVALSRPTAMDVVQRRRFFRVGISLSAALEVLESADPALVGRGDARALTHDVSAGGARIDTTLALRPGDRVRLTVEVPRGLRRGLPERLSADAVVVRSGEQTRRQRKLWSLGIELALASESDRAPWLRLALDLQRGTAL